MLYLDDETLSRMGIVLGEHFATGELDSLGDLLEYAQNAAEYAGEDWRGIAHERSGQEADDASEIAEGYERTAVLMRKLVDAVREGEKQGRADD